MKNKLPENVSSAKTEHDLLTNIRSIGTLTPDVTKVLDVEDVVMIVIIDKKKQKHVRITIPTRIFGGDGAALGNEGEPSVRLAHDPAGDDCVWLVTGKDNEGGGFIESYRECIGGDGNDCTPGRIVKSND